MKRGTQLLAALAIVGLGACSPAQVVVTAEVQAEDPISGEAITRPLSNLEVSLLPYDRDAIFDSLTAAASSPEPQIPSELTAAQEAIAAAQTEWREAENRWATIRDTLQKISQAMEQYSPAEGAYRVLFQEFNDIEAQLGRVERSKDQLFATFDSLQRENISRAQAYNLSVDEWAAEAFADVDAVMLAKERASGLAPAVDTTNANGVAAENFAVKPGQYWVYARYTEVYSELYWNVPLQVTTGEPVTITLNRSNALIRPIF
jgi:hypothetical protein